MKNSVFGVRGLGDEQLEARTLTEAKLASFLAVSPFTYQQLWKLTRVHRNILRVRLDSLVTRNIILKHRYSIPYIRANYGPAFKYPTRYWTPLHNHIYYLLNFSNSKTNRLLSTYLTKPEIKYKKDDYCNVISVESVPLFSLLKNLGSKRLNEIDRYPELMKKFLSRRTYNSIFEIFFWQARFLREEDLAAVKNKVYPRDRKMEETDVTNLKLVVDYFTNKGYDIRDILIRCSTEITYLEGSQRAVNPWATNFLDLPMTRYSIFWQMMNTLGYHIQPA